MELLLLIGLIFVLGIVVLIHFATTADLPTIRQISNTEADPSFHPWCILIECVLIANICYIISNMIYS